MKNCQQIEHSIQKRFRPRLWTPFIRAIKEYQLIEDGDRVAVAISGGKDSFLMAKLFQELYRHGKRNFELIFIAMDPGYLPLHRKHMEKLAGHLNIPLKIFNRNIFTVSQNLSEKPCFLCARMRRGVLYELAKEQGCNKLALGHHYDDVIETILLNVLQGGITMTMMPKLHSKNFSGIELIRPLYYLREKDILQWQEASELSFLDCACPVAATQIDSSRKKIKTLISQLKKDFPQVEESIFASVKHVHLGAVLGTVDNGKERSFLETYKGERLDQ
ncbi:MAG: tRNA 2-thiocytidine biosynthesis protein TtcA [Tissierellia bacterium]|nr:tRNA 2-thiocytidine biosynthesis protein TtcA [Tissierellia bacterium]